jgi:hypothetical protein
MGRGRQKAKQTKVARELKYHSSDIDVTALQRELGGGPVRQPIPPPRVVEEEEDPYAAYVARYSVDDDEDNEGFAAYVARYSADGDDKTEGVAARRRA